MRVPKHGARERSEVLSLPHREPSGPFSLKDAFRQLLRPLVRLLSDLRVRPDTLTILGWTLSVSSAVLFGLGYARVAGLVMLLGGLFDALDGAVARESNRMSAFGAFLDSTLDRLSEAAIFVGIVFFYASVARPYEALLAGAAMAFSLLTSYARARAEGLNIECQVGLLERAGRVVILSAFSMAGMLTFGLYLVAAGALITTAQRILHVRRATRE
jgi:CDP-diacylglycerol---glycerol-3-phosphate 3-phosphatidyltransferase